jgi:transposase-like protein
MTLADQAAMTGQDGQVTEQQPGRLKRRTFTKAYKARILAAFDALPEGSPERGALLRKERLYHSHIEHWRKQAENGTLAVSTGKPEKSAEAEELARLRAENKKLKVANAQLSGELGKRVCPLWGSGGVREKAAKKGTPESGNDRPVAAWGFRGRA